MIKTFITHVEDKVAIRPEMYTMEIVPNVQGTISYNGVEKDILIEGDYMHQYEINEIAVVWIRSRNTKNEAESDSTNALD